MIMFFIVANQIYFLSCKMQVLLPQPILVAAMAVAVMAVDTVAVGMVAVDTEEVMAAVAEVATVEGTVAAAAIAVVVVVVTVAVVAAVGMAVGIVVTPMTKILSQKVKLTKKKPILSLAVKTQVLILKPMKTSLWKFLAGKPLNLSRLLKTLNLVLLYCPTCADASTPGLPLSSVTPSPLAWLVGI
jgi:hypothetical protein